MKIVLVGYMGSGKTTIGKLVSKHLKINFLDLDEYIENAEGQKIPALFEQKGELYFRKKEFFYLNEILNSPTNMVLSTGGGTPCYGTNLETILSATPNTFYLKVSLKELVQRLSAEKEHRPLISGIGDAELPEFIGKHLFERSFYYSQAVNKVSCDGKSSEELAKEIINLLV